MKSNGDMSGARGGLGVYSSLFGKVTSKEVRKCLIPSWEDINPNEKQSQIVKQQVGGRHRLEALLRNLSR